MSIRIGEALIQRGLLDRRQLETALQMQLISGGHLGTYLIELDYIEEDAMARTLGEILGIRSVTREAFQDIPDKAIRSLSRDLVLRYGAIPLGREDRTLHLAVIDPKSLSSLSAATGLRIVPYIAPEIRVIRAMERYYGIPSRRRFVKMSSMPFGTAIRGPARERAGSSPADGSARRRVSDVGPPGQDGPLSSIEDLTRRLSRVESHEELGRVVLDFAGPKMRHAILFDVDGEKARTHGWRGDDLDPVKMRGLTVPVTPDSIFSMVLENAYYRGTVPIDASCGSFYEEVGIDPPLEVLILPVYGDERLEVVLYGDAGPGGRIDGGMETDLVLSRSIGLAMKMVACKAQLRGSGCTGF